MRPALIALAAALVLAVPAAGGTAEPAVGTFADQVDLSAVAGAVPYGDGYAVPLKGRRPAWFTEELERRTKDSDQPVAAPIDAPLPSEVGIRPGSWMVDPYGCTMNFVFQKSGQFAIGTAGHCTDKVGQPVVLLTLAPGSGNPVLVEIGSVIARHDNGIGDDFALVSIKPGLNTWVSPTTAVVGGPCGAYAGFGPETVWHYGHGLVIGTGGTPRAGLALTWKADAFGWDGAAIFGDSGSPVRVTDLKAAGDLQIAKGWTLASSPFCL